MEEKWKEIPGFKDYQISNTGKIRSKERVKKYKSGRVVNLKSKIKRLRKHPKNEFLMTDLIDNKGKRRTVYPHKAVALAFIKNDHPRKNKIVIHKDNDVTNNSVENLAWSSYSESIKKGFETGKRDNSDLWKKRRKKYGPKGSAKPMGRQDPLNPEQRREAYNLRIIENWKLSQIAEKFNCSISHVHKTIRKMSKEPIAAE
tara:strand:- start:69493 stop:70095 length:603 start_codon:yes stop_codon:yes gene_type:complete